CGCLGAGGCLPPRGGATGRAPGPASPGRSARRGGLLMGGEHMHDHCCGTCRWHDVAGFYAFYRANAEGMGDVGFCRKAPPLPDLRRLLHRGVQGASRIDIFVFALWPETDATEWCGAWEPQPDDERRPA